VSYVIALAQLILLVESHIPT